MSEFFDHNLKDDIGQTAVLLVNKLSNNHHVPFPYDFRVSLIDSEKFEIAISDVDGLMHKYLDFSQIKLGTIVDVIVKERSKRGRCGAKRFKIIHRVMIEESQIINIEHIDSCFKSAKTKNKNFVKIQNDGRHCSCFNRSYFVNHD